MDSDSIASSRTSLRLEQSFGASGASTPRTSVASSSLHTGSEGMYGMKPKGSTSSLSPPSPSASLPVPPASPSGVSRSIHHRRRRVAGDSSPKHHRTLRTLDPSPGPGPTAHDISKSAHSALQLLQARSDLQAQQQRDAQLRTNSRAEAHARLTGSAGPRSTTPEPKGKARAPRGRDSTETFFSASSSPRPSLARLVSDPQWASRTSLDSLEPSLAPGRPASIRSNRSNRSNRSGRTSFHSTSSNLDLPGSALEDISAIPEVPHPSDHSSTPQFVFSPDEPRRRRAVSSTVCSRPEPEAPDCVPYLWDVTPDQGHSGLQGTGSLRLPRGQGSAPTAWKEFLTIPSPTRSRTRSTASAPGSRRPSFSAEERPKRPCRTRQPSPARATSGKGVSEGTEMGLSDLTSLRALDMGHRQLTHASSLARTLTRPLSAPLKPVLQFWLAASLSALTLLSLGTLMACSYLLTMYDDASQRTRSVTSAAAKAKAKAHPVTGPFWGFLNLLFAPIRKLFRLDSEPLPAGSSERGARQDDDVGGPDADGKDPLSPPGPRPPLGPLLASLALTLTIAMGTGIYRLFVSYRSKEKDSSQERDASEASPFEPMSQSSAHRAAPSAGARPANATASRSGPRLHTAL